MNEFETAEEDAQRDIIRRKGEQQSVLVEQLKQAVVDYEAKKEKYIAPLPPLTPNSDIEQVKMVLNAILKLL